MTLIEIVAPGPLATIQDRGRPGYAHVGVPRSGAADRPSMDLANRLVGNDDSAAVIEATLGGLRIRTDTTVLVAVTGAPVPVRAGGLSVAVGTAVPLPAGAELALGTPAHGCRTYVSVRGGFDVATTLGSRSTDTLSGLGPAPLSPGDVVGVGDLHGPWPAATEAPLDSTHPDVTRLTTRAGPRRGYLADPSGLFTGEWVATAHSNRVGVRVTRPTGSAAPVLRHRADMPELRSEGVAHGSVQIPPGGEPVIFLADHPVTGGYPVVAVLTASASGRAAQLAAGDRVRFVED
ncbi:biotin-dependent carboxyltransferase family protein [Gordonia sp. NB41Y]|uniref:5-oxoprolinase subunit C family protein n=1 Tax=Gordonia sp. NB41Y TaxID=875808 RepID=UPI0006B18320|nr:biotin-dependent carboxyltransferase family protein [Gordonia sp. NB41Y]KOY49204.1 allophanate hydrolase [Gordonia sp. NB41Y]WLP91997.1 biotin-dependent carboxyltransferase family protein [Gordonia sp. NB41Y]